MLESVETEIREGIDSKYWRLINVQNCIHFIIMQIIINYVKIKMCHGVKERIWKRRQRVYGWTKQRNRVQVNAQKYQKIWIVKANFTHPVLTNSSNDITETKTKLHTVHYNANMSWPSWHQEKCWTICISGTKKLDIKLILKVPTLDQNKKKRQIC